LRFVGIELQLIVAVAAAAYDEAPDRRVDRLPRELVCPVEFVAVVDRGLIGRSAGDESEGDGERRGARLEPLGEPNATGPRRMPLKV